MDRNALLAMCQAARDTARELSGSAHDCGFAPQREARYEIADAFAKFADRLRDAAENSGE